MIRTTSQEVVYTIEQKELVKRLGIPFEEGDRVHVWLPNVSPAPVMISIQPKSKEVDL